MRKYKTMKNQYHHISHFPQCYVTGSPKICRMQLTYQSNYAAYASSFGNFAAFSPVQLITRNNDDSNHTSTNKTFFTRLPGNLHFKFFTTLTGRFIILQTPYQLTKFFYFHAVTIMMLLVTCIRIGFILPPFWVVNKVTICICNIIITRHKNLIFACIWLKLAHKILRGC